MSWKYLAVNDVFELFVIIMLSVCYWGRMIVQNLLLGKNINLMDKYYLLFFFFKSTPSKIYIDPLGLLFTCA